MEKGCLDYMVSITSRRHIYSVSATAHRWFAAGRWGSWPAGGGEGESPCAEGGVYTWSKVFRMQVDPRQPCLMHSRLSSLLMGLQLTQVGGEGLE